jgi:hypothetical protein
MDWGFGISRSGQKLIPDLDQGVKNDRSRIQIRNSPILERKNAKMKMFPFNPTKLARPLSVLLLFLMLYCFLGCHRT